MAWQAVSYFADACVEDVSQGEVIARCKDWSAACVMAAAPALFDKLTDLLIHAEKHFPEGLESELKQVRELLNSVKDNYERRSGTGPNTIPGT